MHRLQFWHITSFCLFLIVATFAALIYNDCRNRPKFPAEPQRIQIERVAKNKSGRYFVKYKAENKFTDIDMGNINSMPDRAVKIFIDVPEGQPIYANLNRGRTPNGEIKHTRGGEIHIRSVEDISNTD